MAETPGQKLQITITKLKTGTRAIELDENEVDNLYNCWVKLEDNQKVNLENYNDNITSRAYYVFSRNKKRIISDPNQFIRTILIPSILKSPLIDAFVRCCTSRECKLEREEISPEEEEKALVTVEKSFRIFKGRIADIGRIADMYSQVEREGSELLSASSLYDLTVLTINFILLIVCGITTAATLTSLKNLRKLTEEDTNEKIKYIYETLTRFYMRIASTFLKYFLQLTPNLAGYAGIEIDKPIYIFEFVIFLILLGIFRFILFKIDNTGIIFELFTYPLSIPVLCTTGLTFNQALDEGYNRLVNAISEISLVSLANFLEYIISKFGLEVSEKLAPLLKLLQGAQEKIQEAAAIAASAIENAGVTTSRAIENAGELTSMAIENAGVTTADAIENARRTTSSDIERIVAVILPQLIRLAEDFKLQAAASSSQLTGVATEFSSQLTGVATEFSSQLTGVATEFSSQFNAVLVRLYEIEGICPTPEMFERLITDYQRSNQEQFQQILTILSEESQREKGINIGKWVFDRGTNMAAQFLVAVAQQNVPPYARIGRGGGARKSIKHRKMYKKNNTKKLNKRKKTKNIIKYKKTKKTKKTKKAKNIKKQKIRKI